MKRPSGMAIEGVALVDAVANDPDDSLRAADDGDAIALSGGNLGVDEDVLELFFATEAKGAKAIAGATGPDGEVSSDSFGVEEGPVRRRLTDVGRPGDDVRFEDSTAGFGPAGDDQGRFRHALSELRFVPTEDEHV